MVDDPATASPSDARLRRVNPAPEARPEAVVLLEELLKTLYPDPPPLDCMTLSNVLARYRLTGLGVPALAAIEQSQRIVRARGEFDLIGLNEFHIGLIYLHWDDHRAAANQFALARQPWSLANDPPAICLAHFAQGLALYHAGHYEPAMLQLSRVERLLDRPAAGSHATRMAGLEAKMRPFLEVTQQTLRDQMWPKEQPAEGSTSPYLTVPPLRGDRTGNGPSGSRPRADNVIYGQAPRQSASGQSSSRAGDDRPSQSETASATGIPRPYSNLPGSTTFPPPGPVPGHLVVDERYGWYTVVEQRGDFLPTATVGAWVLGEREPEPEGASAGREYVVVGSWQAGMGSILLQPVGHQTAVTHCYLGYRETDETGSRIYLDGAGRPVADGALLILAVVAGMWYELNRRVPVMMPELRS